MNKSAKEMGCAAILTINDPGLMTPQGRKNVADWLRNNAKDLVKYGKDYTTRTFRSRYMFTEK